jgi:hypothetical protein
MKSQAIEDKDSTLTHFDLNSLPEKRCKNVMFIHPSTPIVGSADIRKIL